MELCGVTAAFWRISERMFRGRAAAPLSSQPLADFRPAKIVSLKVTLPEEIQRRAGSPPGLQSVGV